MNGSTERKRRKRKEGVTRRGRDKGRSGEEMFLWDFRAERENECSKCGSQEKHHSEGLEIRAVEGTSRCGVGKKKQMVRK